MWQAAPILYVLTSKSYAQRHNKHAAVWKIAEHFATTSESNVVTGIRKKLRNWLGSRSRNTGSSLAKAPVLFRAIMCGLAHSLPTLVLRCFRRRSAMEITAKAASPSLDSCFFDIGAIFSY